MRCFRAHAGGFYSMGRRRYTGGGMTKVPPIIRRSIEMNDRAFDRARGALLAGVMLAGGVAGAAYAQAGHTAVKEPFALSSPDISNGKQISEAQVFNSFGCSGRNVSPALSWKHVPDGAKSFALLVHDPDAPTGSGWWHWVVYDIPADARSLPSGAGDPKKNLMPGGAVQGRTDFGTPGYGGPCPPPASRITTTFDCSR